MRPCSSQPIRGWLGIGAGVGDDQITSAIHLADMSEGIQSRFKNGHGASGDATSFTRKGTKGVTGPRTDEATAQSRLGAQRLGRAQQWDRLAQSGGYEPGQTRVHRCAPANMRAPDSGIQLVPNPLTGDHPIAARSLRRSPFPQAPLRGPAPNIAQPHPIPGLTADNVATPYEPAHGASMCTGGVW
jgi:hypothetical protein